MEFDFVDAAYYGLFGIPDNSLAIMRDDSETPQIFFGYDGTVFLCQQDRKEAVCSSWHGFALEQSYVQVLPKLLRKYPDRYTRAERFMCRWCVRLRHLRSRLA